MYHNTCKSSNKCSKCRFPESINSCSYQIEEFVIPGKEIINNFIVKRLVVYLERFNVFAAIDGDDSDKHFQKIYHFCHIDRYLEYCPCTYNEEVKQMNSTV